MRISVAVASYPENRVSSSGALLELVDKILNRVKEYGGNRVFSSEDIANIKKEKLEESKPIATKEFHYLKGKMDRLNKRANQSLIESIFAFAKTLELKDHYTGEHVEKTVRFATETARELGLPIEEINSIKQASILHDLGKVGISEKILCKKSKLSKRELKIIREHPVIGADIIRPIHLLHDLLPLIMYHHEKWDGSGYPLGLREEEIPIGARIIALADAYQALISNRPYRKAYSKKKALDIILKETGSHFDPKITEAFLNILKRDA